MTHQTTSPLLPPVNQLPARKRLIRRLAGAGYHVLRGGVRRLRGALYFEAKVVRNLAHWLLNQSDYRRWTNPINHETWWDSRTEKIAGLIPPTSRVIEFGAGRRQLEQFLDRSCKYIPSDLIDGGPETIVCDLNQRPLPDLRYVKAEVAVFSGVLEYIRDLESLIEWLSEQVCICIASYAYVPTNQNGIQKIRNKFDRLYYGYMNNYTEEELLHLFNRYGFVCTTKEIWTSQRIFMFANQHQPL